ncbi:DUF397 domain-containing protein [Actinomadura violacea]|uniref:DUF397 domain-containing protein n=1 Tax=Actinomadura violacea TaxID=2819934 RepID=A0ABS3SC05_9ACTN|nr:DUF397 domain-containing protein [Actinomadura violacea]MBO2465760.1 DUF397 domain-containing protein [Actinomadura violacea]
MSADFARAKWRKSSRSNTEQACVEVARASTAIGVRDSKNPNGGHIALDRAAFTDLLKHVKAGALDL